MDFVWDSCDDKNSALNKKCVVVESVCLAFDPKYQRQIMMENQAVRGKVAYVSEFQPAWCDTRPFLAMSAKHLANYGVSTSVCFSH